MAITLLKPSFKLIQYVGETTVSAKELYNYLDVTEDFQLWGFRVLRQHYETRDYFSKYRHEEDFPFDYFALDHLLTIECAKDVCLQHYSIKGRMSYLFLLQFQNGEKKANAVVKKLREDRAKLADKEFEQSLEYNGWIGCISDLY